MEFTRPVKREVHPKYNDLTKSLPLVIEADKHGLVCRTKGGSYKYAKWVSWEQLANYVALRGVEPPRHYSARRID